MSREKIAVLNGTNASVAQLEAARLMTLALSSPEDAEHLIAQAVELFLMPAAQNAESRP